MTIGPPYHLPDDKEEKLRKARRLEWVTILYMISAVAVLGLTLGSSQAMKAAWVEDLLSLIPPAAFLIAMRFRSKPPDEHFPYGYRRAVSVAFLCAALALFSFGAYILSDSVLKLVKTEHPTIGTIELFGRQIWQGWLMIAALVYSSVPPVVLGRMKLPLARELHGKVLYADADMNKADWMTGGAAMIGILGIGIGWWWADAVAAGLISLDIVKDGFTHLKGGIKDLMDERPTIVGEDEPDELPERLRRTLEQLDWVAEASVRLREEGDVLTGEAYVVPHDESHLLDRLRQASDLVSSFHWRIYDVIIVPVRSLREQQEKQKAEGGKQKAAVVSPKC